MVHNTAEADASTHGPQASAPQASEPRTSEPQASEPQTQEVTTHEPTTHETHEPSTTENATPTEDATNPKTQPPPKNSVIINIANVLDPAISNNPVLSAAIQVLDQVSEVGKVLPFVAPAFVLLKIIIDLEKRATEVDVKCVDLVERIAFMLSHVPVLEQVEITPSIRKVVDRINEAMKDAAALIEAYRKQGRVARRLRLSNRDKFTTCVDAVNKCCNDLLISLQIHQTVQLGDILTRGVPTDPEDAAAASFVSSHGGSVDAVVHNRELVGEFAKQQHLTMDDSVMEQLNTNFTELIQQNHGRLEGILQENINASIVAGLRSIASDMLSLEAEQKFTCVQCEKEFTNRINGPNACAFHLTDDYRTKKRLYECCNSTTPCQSGKHRAEHHCEYPYANFFPRIREALAYTTTSSAWAAVEDTNLETNMTEDASVGRISSWSRNGSHLSENTIYVMIGQPVWYRDNYYFNTFTPAELREVEEAVRVSRDTLIFRTSADEGQYAMGEWVLSDSGKFTGIRLSAKAATSTQASVRLCPIDPSTCLQDGEVETISKGGLRSYTPNAPYILPDPVRVGPELKQESTRAVRTDFKTEVSPGLRVILKTMSDPPLVANPDFSPHDSDCFQGTVSLFNNNAADSRKSVSIMSASAIYRLVGDTNYASVTKFQLLDNEGQALPMTIEPRQFWRIKFKATIPRTEDDANLRITWKNKAFVARYRPLRLKLIIEDVEGEKCSLVLEYLYQPTSTTFKKPNPNDTHLLSFDNYITFDRQYVHISESMPKDEVITIHGASLTLKHLQRVVYQSLKTGVSEVDLGIGQEPFPGEWAWTAWALVDLSCRRVYAFKIVLHDGKIFQQKHFGAVYYVPCPPYDEPLEEVRDIKCATESSALPPLEPYTIPDYPQDDDLDDEQPVVIPQLPLFDSPPAVASTLSNGGKLELALVDLNAKLASVDANLTTLNTVLARVAVAFEKLVENKATLTPE